MGVNGAGKSTLLKLAAGAIEADQGDVIVGADQNFEIWAAPLYESGSSLATSSWRKIRLTDSLRGTINPFFHDKLEKQSKPFLSVRVGRRASGEGESPESVVIVEVVKNLNKPWGMIDQKRRRRSQRCPNRHDRFRLHGCPEAVY